MTPSPYPDCKVWAKDFEDNRMPAWDIRITNQINGFPVDLSGSALFAPVLDGGVEVGELIISRDEDTDGHLVFQLTKEMFEKLGRYSVWRLHEETLLNSAVVEGKIVKNA